MRGSRDPHRSLLEAANEIEIARVARLTGVAEGGTDSLHRLVMDLHQIAQPAGGGLRREILSGAHVFGLNAEDARRWKASCRGSTRPHPEVQSSRPRHDGDRSGGRLLIQNDIGTTTPTCGDRGQEERRDVTYTDVHRARAKFSSRCSTGFRRNGAGSIAMSRRVSARQRLLPRHRAISCRQRRRSQRLPERAGAALVFLIDWNKARKLLRSWVAKDDATRILDWAARQRIGQPASSTRRHELIGAAVRNAAPTGSASASGWTALGRNAAVDFLKARCGCRPRRSASRSVRLVRDQIEADLVRRLERVDSALLATVLRQIGLAHDITAAIAHHVARFRPAARTTQDARARAGLIERKAIASHRSRKEAARLNAGPIIEQLVDRVERRRRTGTSASSPRWRRGNRLRLLTDLAELCAVAITATEAAASGLAAAIEVPEDAAPIQRTR